MSTTHRLALPLKDDDLARLEVGDLVYLDGEIVVTVGLPTHKRIAEYLDAGKKLPMDLAGGMLCQVGTFVEDIDGEPTSRYINPSTSTRFEPYLPTIIAGLKLKAVGGKGGVGPKTIDAMRQHGCVYLSFVGGASALTSEAVIKVVDVQWHDFITQFRLTKLRVEALGPLNVGVDIRGNSLYDQLTEAAKAKLPDIMAMLNRERGTSQ